MIAKTPQDAHGYESVIEAAGRKAFQSGLAATDCPYSFQASPYWDTKDYARFDAEYRPKLNLWMRGWIAEKKAQKE